MKVQDWLKLFALLLLVVSLAISPALAQDAEEGEADEPTDTDLGTVVVEVESWIAQPAGLQYLPTSRASVSDPAETRALDVPYGTRDRFRYRAGYRFRDNIGEFLLTYWSHNDSAGSSWFEPSQFVFAELAASDFRPGVFEDGLSDAVIANTETKMRDLRLDFFREAFEGKRISARWFVGYRRVSHDRELNAQYFALAPNLPPALPPVTTGSRPDLAPLPDTARIASRYSGRGAGAGLEVDFPVRRGRLSVEAGFALAVLRGKLDFDLESATHFYAITEGGDQISQFVDPPFSEFDELDDLGNPVLSSIQQIRGLAALKGNSESTTGQVLETHLGLRFKIWKRLEGTVGFRNVRYADVGSDPRGGTVLPNGDLVASEIGLDGVRILRLTVTNPSQKNRSVDYEGYYLGLAWTY